MPISFRTDELCDFHVRSSCAMVDQDALLANQRRRGADLAQRQALCSGFYLQPCPGDEMESFAERLRYFYSTVPIYSRDHGIMV